MREEKAVPEYCKNNPKKIRAYQCDICDVLDVDERPVAWAIAQRKSDRWLGRRLGVHNMTAAARKQAMLEALAVRWSGLGMRPDAEDVRRACRFFHNNF